MDSAFAVSLGGLDPAATYGLEVVDDARHVQTRTQTGRELMADWELRLPGRGSSLVIRYRRTDRK